MIISQLLYSLEGNVTDETWSVFLEHIHSICNQDRISNSSVGFIDKYFVKDDPGLSAAVVSSIQKWNKLIVPIVAAHEGISKDSQYNTNMALMLNEFLELMCGYSSQDVVQSSVNVIANKLHENEYIQSVVTLVCMYVTKNKDKNKTKIEQNRTK